MRERSLSGAVSYYKEIAISDSLKRLWGAHSTYLKFKTSKSNPTS